MKKIKLPIINLKCKEIKCWCPPGMEETGQFVKISAVLKTTLFIYFTVVILTIQILVGM